MKTVRFLVVAAVCRLAPVAVEQSRVAVRRGIVVTTAEYPLFASYLHGLPTAEAGDCTLQPEHRVQCGRPAQPGK